MKLQRVKALGRHKSLRHPSETVRALLHSPARTLLLRSRRRGDASRNATPRHATPHHTSPVLHRHQKPPASLTCPWQPPARLSQGSSIPASARSGPRPGRTRESFRRRQARPPQCAWAAPAERPRDTRKGGYAVVVAVRGDERSCPLLLRQWLPPSGGCAPVSPRAVGPHISDKA